MMRNCRKKFEKFWINFFILNNVQKKTDTPPQKNIASLERLENKLDAELEALKLVLEANMLWIRGDIKKALRNYKRAYKLYPEELSYKKLYQECLAETHFLRAKKLWTKGKRKKALEHYEKAYKLCPKQSLYEDSYQECLVETNNH